MATFQEDCQKLLKTLKSMKPWEYPLALIALFTAVGALLGFYRGLWLLVKILIKI